MTKILTIEKCTDCPFIYFVQTVGVNTMNISCDYMKFNGMIEGGLAQPEIDLLNNWFSKCELPDSYSQAEEE